MIFARKIFFAEFWGKQVPPYPSAVFYAYDPIFPSQIKPTVTLTA